MIEYIIYGLLLLFLIYLLVWSVKLYNYMKRQKKVKRLQELRAKGNEIKRRTIDCTKDYWYNLREVEDCKPGEDIEKYYHYFIGVDQGVEELLIEMYDCGIIRTDELEEIAYGKHHYRNVDLSFLEELEREIQEEADFDDEQEELDEKADLDTSVSLATTFGESLDEDIIQIVGAEDDFFREKDDVVEAAKQLDANDTGITDIHGTLSEGVEKVIAAVEAQENGKKQKEEPILPKKEKSIEEARAIRERTANPKIRNKIYEKWVSYVFELYELVNINANEDTKHKIRKALMDYGYNDIDVLLECPGDL